jgi:hypothetical protein
MQEESWDAQTTSGLLNHNVRTTREDPVCALDTGIPKHSQIEQLDSRGRIMLRLKRRIES